ncbi:hypothetical protein RI129_005526 [Pyrocoelia pectoralis]|uniref:Reverse transcriptase domain-containing protein n=1 Tax=Pyrocoelia pectoralis TaxID=417401 RepID=A0AAN7ZLM2_9COLE
MEPINQYLAGRARSFHNYKKLSLKLKVTSLKIWFNSTCLRLNLIPNYIQLATKNTSISARSALEAGKLHWLKQEIKHWYNIRDKLSLYMYESHLLLSKFFHPIEVDMIISLVKDNVEIAGSNLFVKLNSKIMKLTNEKVTSNNHSQFHYSNQHNNVFTNQNTFRFHNRTINLSQTRFGDEEMRLLNMGLKHNPQTTDNLLLDQFKLDLEVVLHQNSQNPNTNNLRAICAEKLKKLNFQPGKFNNNILKGLKAKIRKADLVVTKADKGNTIVILEKDNYVKKVQEFLDANGYIIKKVNFNQFIKSVKQFITLNREILKTHFDLNHYRLILMNPMIPRLYALPKIHKLNYPMRPIVAFTNTPVSKLSNWLNHILRSALNFQFPYAIKNSIELSRELSKFKVNNDYKLISLDIVNLFPSVPFEASLEIVNEYLSSSNLPDSVCAFLSSSLELVYKQNFLNLTINLSPLLAELFLTSLENNKIFNNQWLTNHFAYYKRYVDDIFVIFKGSDNDIDHCFQHMNTLHPHIKFTLEKENNRVLNFLDLQITRNTNRLDINIFRKPTTTDHVIPFSSHHPLSHKLAAFRFFFNRLFSLPLNTLNFNKEYHLISEVAFRNGYPRNLIEKLFHNFSRKVRLQNRTTLNPRQIDSPNNNFYSLPFIGPASFYFKKLLKEYDINISFSAKHNLKNHLVKTKDKIDTLEKSGVYRLSCSTCGACYVGQTGRKFKTRFNEHYACIRNNNIFTKSAFADHILDRGHSFNPNLDYEILHVCDKSIKLNILEQKEILHFHNQNPSLSLNEVLNINKSLLL